MDKLTIFYYVFQFFLLLIAERMVGVFYDKRRTSFKAMLLSLLAIYTLFSLVHLFIVNFINPSWSSTDILLVFVGSFIITFNYSSSLPRRFIVAFSTAVILLFSIIVLGGLIVPLLLPNIPVASDEWVMVSNILFIPFGLLFAKFLKQFKSLKKKATFTRISLLAPLTGLLIVLLIISIPVASSFGIDITKVASTFIVLILIAWFLFSSLFLSDILAAKYEDKLRMNLHAQEKEYYYTQCQLMQESAEQVKAVRHDMVSHFTALKTLSADGDREQIEAYLNRLLHDIQISEHYSNTGNIAFDSIINYKLRNCKKENIQLDIDIAVPPDLNIEMADIVSIIGNLLDNALEAVAKVEDKSIKLEIKYFKGCLFIKVENPFTGQVNYEIGKTDEAVIKSLKSGDAHGHGLKNVLRSLEKYNGSLKISHSDSLFVSGIILYVSDKYMSQNYALNTMLEEKAYNR